MAHSDPQKTADSTWHAPPLWQWRIRFFASLCLFAFLFGLMLGALLKPAAVPAARLLQVEALDGGLELCFSRLPRAAVTEQEGAFVMRLAVTPTEPRQGVLELPEGQQAHWRLTSRSDGMQLGIVGLQPVRGRWEPVPEQPLCIRVQVAGA